MAADVTHRNSPLIELGLEVDGITHRGLGSSEGDALAIFAESPHETGLLYGVARWKVGHGIKGRQCRLGGKA